MQAEVFFIYHNGEQRGPYTAAQVNHLHRCAFIDDDTLYWREGLEQWQPVGQIVLRRKRRNRMLFWFILLGAIVVIADINEKEGGEVAETIGTNKAVFQRLDVTDKSSADAAVAATLQGTGRPSLLPAGQTD